MRCRRTQQCHRRPVRAGFTLIEIMIVLAIIGVIAAMAVPKLIGQQQQANKKITVAAINDLEKTVNLYAIENNGELPQSVDLVYQPSPDGGAPLADKKFTDAWGQELLYEVDTSNYGAARIWSTGPDRQNNNGSGDDINNWDDRINSK